VTVDRSLPLADASRLEGVAGRYTARLSPEWGIWGPNGSYLATIALREWLRFRPDAPVDDPFLAAARSLILLDTYGWPTAWRTHGDGPYIAPNLGIAAWFYPAASPTEWLLVDYEHQVGHLGRLGVAGRVWDADGRLVAIGGGQLLCVPA
jgi:acyl-CoA thioesterase